jgi:3-deoxy-manno-octulosonate cytidylyltransferase (CMP-KDO synthetase)
MLWHVYQGVSKAQSISAVWVLTHSPEVLEADSSWGASAMLTAEECPSGTDRIASVVDALDADIIVNVQGDEPLIKGVVVDKLVSTLQESGTDVTTPVYSINSVEEVLNPNIVKVVRDREGKALYFSRSPIPHVRDAELKDWISLAPFWGHVGVYAYWRKVLVEYPQLPEGWLEQVEKLEQLRLLEAGKQILTVAIDYSPNVVDVPGA